MGINGQVIIGSTRTGPLNARTCPVNVRVSIALTSVNLNFKLHVPRPRSCRIRRGGVHVPRQGFKIITSAKNTVKPGRQIQVRLAAGPRSDDWLAVHVNLKLQRLRLPVLSGKYDLGRLSDAKGQAVSSQLLRFCPGPDFHQLSLDLNPAGPAIWSQTGCKPDSELSSRRYCFGAAAILQLGNARCGPPTSSDWGPPKQGQEQQFEMLHVRIEGLFLLCSFQRCLLWSKYWHTQCSWPRWKRSVCSQGSGSLHVFTEIPQGLEKSICTKIQSMQMKCSWLNILHQSAVVAESMKI